MNEYSFTTSRPYKCQEKLSDAMPDKSKILDNKWKLLMEKLGNANRFELIILI